MMGALERFEKEAGKIADAYAALEDQIFGLIIKVLKDGDYKHVDQKDVVMWQMKQLQKIGQLNQETINLVAHTDGISEQAVTDLVKFHGMQISDEVDREIKDTAGDKKSVSNDVYQLIGGIAAQTWQDLQNNVNEGLVSRNYGDSIVTKAYRKVLTESTAATVSGVMTHDDAVRSAMYRIVDKGLPTKLTDKAGHTWSIESYTRMVVSTTVHRTYNEVRTKRMKDFGMTVALMSSHPNSRPACAHIQGKVVNLVPHGDPAYDPRFPTIYDYDYGEPAGTLGINCRHVLSPFDPEINVNNQPQYDPEEAIENGKLVQQQRARERAIRDAKKRLMAAQEFGDQDAINRAKTLIRSRQDKLRSFIKDTNADKGKPILTRDYSREQIVK